MCQRLPDYGCHSYRVFRSKVSISYLFWQKVVVVLANKNNNNKYSGRSNLLAVAVRLGQRRGAVDRHHAERHRHLRVAGAFSWLLDRITNVLNLLNTHMNSTYTIFPSEMWEDGGCGFVCFNKLLRRMSGGFSRFIVNYGGKQHFK